MNALSDRFTLDKTINNHYLAFYPDGSPIVLFLDNQPFVCVFSTTRRLQEKMEIVGIDKYQMKHIIHQDDFFKSLDGHPVRVMLDPYLHMGKTRFTELFWEKT